MTVIASNLGFPRIGSGRELKKALDSYWAGTTSAAELLSVAAALRERHWLLQAQLGIAHVPSGDFSLYDHVADTAVMLGAVPERYASADAANDLDAYFAMARGGNLGGREVTALEMTKWFDTNYHYLVPELSPGQKFALAPGKQLAEVRQARALGVATRPVVLGPVSFLLLSKRPGGGSNLDLLPELCNTYSELLSALQAEGVAWAQMDEPVLATDLDPAGRDALVHAYSALREAAPGLRLLVATYFAGLGPNLPTALALPVDALHLDAVNGRAETLAALRDAPGTMSLSLGVVDGRNVWRTDLEPTLDLLEEARRALGPDRLMVAPSCSLMHLPVDARPESGLGAELQSWLAFATQRLEEVAALARGLNEGRAAIADALAESRAASLSRSTSPLVHDSAVADRLAAAGPGLELRASPYATRRRVQAGALGLPMLPTTTIGSFPQTPEIRSLRARHRSGAVTTAQYEAGLRSYVDDAVAFQEEVGLDVLVHGEAERTDMVEHFGERLSGFAVTAGGWVQSYGSRCVKPPVVFGDVSRPLPMTVDWATYAQSRTSRPVKGMLTGPLTLLHWSFVRNDQPLEVTARQLALAVRDEVADLEAAGIKVVQIDEPALREGLPLQRAQRPHYLEWAVRAFRLASGGAHDQTQIHTHMCYSDLEDVMGAISAFDADVISVEASRSQMSLLGALAGPDQPNEVGPGIWDVHSPRVPGTPEMVALLEAALAVVPADRLWVNPDCGLKTRGWAEVKPALANMVAAARQVREELATRPAQR